MKDKGELSACMASFNLVVVASVRPPATAEEQANCQATLDRLEADLLHRLNEHSGMNIRDENIRRQGL